MAVLGVASVRGRQNQGQERVVEAGAHDLPVLQALRRRVERPQPGALDQPLLLGGEALGGGQPGQGLVQGQQVLAVRTSCSRC